MEFLAFIIGILILLVGLTVSIGLHEIGHLVPAKKFGVHVGQYMIGFGRTLWSRRKGETEYGVKLLPLGGYISMAGMYPVRARVGGEKRGRFFASMVQDSQEANAETMEGVDPSRAFYRLPIWKRIVVMLGGPVMNLILAVVLFGVLFSGIGMQQTTTTLAAVSPCVASAQGECTAADPVGPASAAGLLPGDRIVSLSGREVTDFAEVSAIVRDNPGRALTLVYLRDGAEHTTTLTPATVEQPVIGPDGKPVVGANGEVETAPAGMIGVTSQVDYVKAPLWEAPRMAAENVTAVAQMIVRLPAILVDTVAGLFTGAERDPNGPISLVGVGALAGGVASADAPVLDRIAAMFGLLGSLNVALFVFNLLPLLPLDGGHIAVALWDGVRRIWAKLRGKEAPAPTDASVLTPVTLVVVVALIAMTVVLAIADVVNPVKFL